MPGINSSFFNQKSMSNPNTTQTGHKNLKAIQNKISLMKTDSMRKANSQNRMNNAQEPNKISPNIIAENIWLILQQTPKNNTYGQSEDLQYDTAPYSLINRISSPQFNSGLTTQKQILIHANEMKASKYSSSIIMAQAPHGSPPQGIEQDRVKQNGRHQLQSPSMSDSVWQHWYCIFEQHANIVEIVNPQIESTHTDRIFEFYGLNFIHPAMLKSVLPNIHVGPFKILNIQERKPKRHKPISQVRERQYELLVLDTRTNKSDALCYQIFETKYSQKLLTADTLKVLVQHQNQNKPIWVTSQTGVARPSAFLIANAIQTDIKRGVIKNIEALKIKVLGYVLRGREIRGERFLHSYDQLYELIRFGIILLDQPTFTGCPIEEETTRANLHNYPMRWIPYQQKRTNRPIADAKVFKSKESIHDFGELLARLRSALYL